LLRLVVLVYDVKEASGAMGGDIVSSGGGTHDLLPLGALAHRRTVRIRSYTVI